MEETKVKMQDVLEVMDYIKAPRGNLGYKYILECMMLLNSQEYEKEDFSKISVFYVDVAKKCDFTFSRVERAIRHEIEVIFSNRSNEEALNKVFGSYRNYNGKLTNKEFLVSLYYYLVYYKNLPEEEQV